MHTPLALDLAALRTWRRGARRRSSPCGGPPPARRPARAADRPALCPLGLGHRRAAQGGRRAAPAGPRGLCVPHAELEFKAGDWTLRDDGSSQNGTYANGLRIHGRRLISHGDLLRIGQTSILHLSPGLGWTLAPAKLGIAPKFSEQQGSLRGLCRPLMGDGEGLNPAMTPDRGRDRDRRGGRDDRVDHLGRSFGLQDIRLGARARRSRCWRCAPAWSRPTRTGAGAAALSPSSRADELVEP